MLGRIFPKVIDNVHRGHWLAVLFLIPLVLMKLAIGTNSMINTRFVATSADGIPLDSYGAAGAQAVIAFFAVWGLCMFLLGLLGIVVLIRYRAMIPLMYLILLLEQGGRKALFIVNPIATPGAPMVGVGGVSYAFLINLAFLVLLLIGFALSLYKKSDSAT
jgi:hypothetical protein